MAVSTLMVLGSKALTANYAALQTTGHNIANANVAGYSRQQAELATARGQFSGAGYFGMGVDVTTVSRAHNVFLAREATAASSLAAMDASRLAQLQRLEGVFRTGEGGLGFAATQFLNGFAELANRPSDAAVRQVVLGRAAELGARFAEAGAQLDQLQANLRGELQAGVNEVNGRPTTCSTSATGSSAGSATSSRSAASTTPTARWRCSSAAGSGWCWARRPARWRWVRTRPTRRA
jgi:flagellar hook-associated protein 1 FlgK